MLRTGQYVGRIEQILQEDQALPRKQRHTAKRIWGRLRGEGYTGGYTVVKDQVRDFTELNGRLRQQCVEDRERRLRGQASIFSIRFCSKILRHLAGLNFGIRVKNAGISRRICLSLHSFAF